MPEEVLDIDEDLLDSPLVTPPVFQTAVKVYADTSVDDVPAAASATDLIELFNNLDASALAQIYWDVSSGDLRVLTQQGNLHLHALGTNGSDGKLLIHNAVEVTGSALISTTITTGAPTGGAGAWKLGKATVATPTAPDRVVAVEIDGVTLYLHAKTTNT